MDRISNINPNRTRVQETEDRGGRGRRDEEEEEKKKKDKDKFDKGKPFWKRLLSDPASKPVRTPRSLAGGAKPRWDITEREELTPAPPEDEFSDTGSVTEDISLSQRFLVVAGVFSLSGRPRWAFILAYVLIASVILVSTFLIFGIIL